MLKPLKVTLRVTLTVILRLILKVTLYLTLKVTLKRARQATLLEPYTNTHKIGLPVTLKVTLTMTLQSKVMDTLHAVPDVSKVILKALSGCFDRSNYRHH